MRSRAIGIVALLSLALVLSGAILFVIAQEHRQMFTVSRPNEVRKGPNTLTEAEVREALQRWHNDPDHPLKILKVRTDKQGPPREFVFRSGGSDWLPVSRYLAPPDPSPAVRCVPVTYRQGPLTYDLLFVIDRGAVLTFFDTYKRAP